MIDSQVVSLCYKFLKFQFGIGFGVISKRPRELSQTPLAQYGTLIALRTANPRDQEYILSSMKDVIGELVEGLSGLATGEALVSGSAAPVPAVVRFLRLSSQVRHHSRRERP